MSAGAVLSAFLQKSLKAALSGTKPSGVLSVVLTGLDVLCLGFSSRASFTRLRSKQRQPTKAKGKVFGNNEVELFLSIKRLALVRSVLQRGLSPKGLALCLK